MSRRKMILIGVDQAIPYLLDKFLEEGVMPHLKKLVNRGVTATAFPCIPTDTPTNWTTIATGANVEKHGATSFYLHLSGESFGEGLKQENRSRTQLRKYCEAEYIWDVLDQEGVRTFVFNYPAGWLTNLQNGVMSLLSWRIPESKNKIIANPRTEEFQFDTENPVITIAHGIQATIIDTQEISAESLSFSISVSNQTLAIDEWSDWMSIEVKDGDDVFPCLFKIKLADVSPDGKVKIRYSTIYNTSGWSIPDSFGENLIRNVMDPEYVTATAENIGFLFFGETSHFFLEAEQETRLVSRAVEYAKKHFDWQICFFHIHFLDTLNHILLSNIYDESSKYSEESFQNDIGTIRSAYGLVDNLVGQLQESVIDDDTIVVFVSDHGAVPAWKIANIPRVLVDAGLLVYKSGRTSDELVVDWSRTKAFPYLEPPYIWVNRKGRDPQGIVSDSEYQNVVDEIIEALENMRDPETNEKIINKVIRRDEAHLYGQDSDRVGDVIFLLNPPYQLFDGDVEALDSTLISTEELERSIAYPATICFGAHAYYSPECTIGPFSISAPLVIAGPGIKKGIVMNKAVNLSDVAPTISHLIGIRHPKHSQGRVLEEILE